MQLLRSSLLWASQSRRMERVVRSSRAMRPLISRFMPGETLDDAMRAVRQLQSEKTPVIMTSLGENVASNADADATVEEYVQLFTALADARADAHVSIKLTQFGWDIDQRAALQRVRRLLEIAQSRDTILAVDMESSPYVESTVAAYESLAAESRHVALCLQAYLHRTPGDLRRLEQLRPYIRLVKGAYREPANVALESRAEIDARYRELARQLLAGMSGGTRAVFGTHDMALVRQLRAEARSLGVAESTFEIQMLYGIQDAGRRELAASGMRTRVLISYGRAWYPWFMRRLAEKPSNLMLAARSLIS